MPECQPPTFPRNMQTELAIGTNVGTVQTNVLEPIIKIY